MRDLGCAEVGEIPNFSEDEPMLSARIVASFLTELFHDAGPGGFDHLSFVSDCFPPYVKEMKYESSCCPPIWRS